MGLLNQDERQKLIDLLCQLPGVETYLPVVRDNLVATLPGDLRQNMIFINATKTDITRIVDEVSSDLWARAKLPDGSYPLLVVIKNAINMVRGSPLEPELYKQNNMQRAKFGLPLEEIPGPKPPQLPDEFLQKLYSFIELLPILKNELDG